MRRSIALAGVLTAALAAVLAPALAAAQESVTFHAAVPQAGESIAYATGGVMQFKTAASAGGREIRSQSIDVKSAENYQLDILDANADAPRRGRVRYFQSESTSSADQAAAKREVGPVAGKTYLLAVNDASNAGSAGLQVTDERGQPVSAEEDKEVRGDFPVFGHTDALCRYLDGKTVTTGKPLEDLDPAVAATLLGAKAGEDEMDQLSLELHRIEHHAGLTYAVFQVRMSGVTDVAGTPMRIALAGYVTMTAEDCRLRSSHLEGRMAMQDQVKTQDGGQLDMRMTGSARILMHLGYAQ